MRLYAILLVIFTFGVGIIFAQSDRGSIRGTVTDPNGAAVVGAKVVLTSNETNETRETTSSEDGFFAFPELRAGTYRVAVEATGFNRVLLDNVKVEVQIIRSVEIKLEIGSVSGNVVNVTADAAVINTESPVRQTNVTERQVKELPLLVATESGGRTPLAFIFSTATLILRVTPTLQQAERLMLRGSKSAVVRHSERKF
ncbi:MAG: carboxypeptidase regulatory-like domain-containing protein [Blastocatellia bacterium]|nr:carboxypeptidase regulatory-like domain-containing protein [Blastocatellia bacterium]